MQNLHLNLTKKSNKTEFKSCVYFFQNINTNINTDIKQNKKNKYNNLLVKNSFFVHNELTNIQKLYNIYNYSDFFYIPENTNRLKIAEYNDQMLSSDIICDDDTVLFKFKITQLIYFESYLKKNSGPQFILKLCDTFEDILLSIAILYERHIVHNNIKMETIIYNELTDRVLLCNFRFSIDLQYGNNKIQYLKRLFLTFDPSYNYWPIEIHLISFMLTNNLNSLSGYNIEYVINEVSKHSIIHKFNKTILDEFVSSALQYFQKYINKSLDEFIIDILKFANTWDTYSLCFVYLNILVQIYDKLTSENKKNKFIILFMKLLVNNLHFNPEKRLSSSYTLLQFKIMLESIEPNDYICLLNNLQ